MNRSRLSIVLLAVATFVLGTLALASQPAPGEGPGKGFKRGHRPCFDRGYTPPPCPPCQDYKQPQCVCMKIPGCKVPSAEPL